MHMRPVQKMPEYKPIDRTGLAEEQATPEYKAEVAKFRSLLAELAGKTKMEAK